METNLFTSVKKAIKYWWVSLLVGIIALILGIFCLFTPFSTFAALTILFVASFLVGGIAEIVFAISNRETLNGWGWTLAMGIIDIIFAVILMANMELAPLMLCYLIAFWMLIQSIWGIGMACDLQPVKHSGWGWLLALSILGVLASILLLFQPAVAGLFAAYIISFALLTYGIMRIYIAFKLKSMHKYLPENNDN